MKTIHAIVLAAATLWLAFALSGCATSKERYAADGSMVYAIECYAQSTQSCTEKAGEICGMLGYHFVTPDGMPVSADSVLKPAAPPAAAEAAPAAPPADPKTAYVPRSSSAASGDAGGKSGWSSFWPFADRKFDLKLYIQCRP